MRLICWRSHAKYELFNSALQLPQFTSEEDLLSVGELELVRNAIANHRAYLDPSFIRKMTNRWEKIYSAAAAGIGGGGGGGGGAQLHLDRASTDSGDFGGRIGGRLYGHSVEDEQKERRLRDERGFGGGGSGRSARPDWGEHHPGKPRHKQQLAKPKTIGTSTESHKQQPPPQVREYVRITAGGGNLRVGSPAVARWEDQDLDAREQDAMIGPVEMDPLRQFAPSA